jgi:hypothetical protein
MRELGFEAVELNMRILNHTLMLYKRQKMLTFKIRLFSTFKLEDRQWEMCA